MSHETLPGKNPVDSIVAMTLGPDIEWKPASTIPRGAEFCLIKGPMNEASEFIVWIKYPKDYMIPPHRHPTTEHFTVLSGLYNFGIGRDFNMTKTKAMPPGSVVILPPNVPHYVWTDRETVVQIHGVGPFGSTYLNAADDPR
jgi:quercetin dioxygenase-like cupin family protein